MSPTLLDAVHQLEKVPIRFPFANEVAAGVTIVSVTPSCEISSGTDADPAGVMSGSPVIASSSSDVYQLVEPAARGGNQYIIMMVATLSNGLKLVRAGLLPVITFKEAA